MKYDDFQKIPQFTRDANYRVNISWDYIEFTLDHWNQPDNGNGLELDPDFQRAHVWNEAKQIAYVEYILRGGKAAREIQFNCSSWMGKFNTPVQLVDGKQRLEAARKFIRNELPAFGTLLKDYKGKLRALGGGPDFIFAMNTLPTRVEVLQWYLDLNTGGIVHTSEEINKVRKLLEAEKKRAGQK